jgi:Asp-tRNA(Asn)/Glu-tRNA(Gln) amidotransferase A subunit family amidase
VNFDEYASHDTTGLAALIRTGEIAPAEATEAAITRAEAVNVPCSHGSRLWDGFVPDHDAEIVARYRRAGLALIGKSNTPEVGLAATTESVRLGPCRNPWDLARTPGDRDS